MKLPSPVRYPGGKAAAVVQICDLAPEDVREYREPFCGGASVFFRARAIQLASKYWLNDLDSALMNFWKVAQTASVNAVMVQTLMRLHSDIRAGRVGAEEQYRRARENLLSKSTFQGVGDACDFYYLNRVSFSGAGVMGGFSRDSALGRFTEARIRSLSSLPLKLDRNDVALTCGDAADVINTPGSSVFLFVDPPYLRPRKLYRHEDIDHEALARLLRRTSHRFLLTYDDCKEVRDLYSWAHITTWSKKYGMTNVGGVATRDGAELFISNYEVKI